MSSVSRERNKKETKAAVAVRALVPDVVPPLTHPQINTDDDLPLMHSSKSRPTDAKKGIRFKKRSVSSDSVTIYSHFYTSRSDTQHLIVRRFYTGALTKTFEGRFQQFRRRTSAKSSVVAQFLVLFSRAAENTSNQTIMERRAQNQAHGHPANQDNERKHPGHEEPDIPKPH